MNDEDNVAPSESKSFSRISPLISLDLFKISEKNLILDPKYDFQLFLDLILENESLSLSTEPLGIEMSRFACNSPSMLVLRAGIEFSIMGTFGHSSTPKILKFCFGISGVVECLTLLCWGWRYSTLKYKSIEALPYLLLCRMFWMLWDDRGLS